MPELLSQPRPEDAEFHSPLQEQEEDERWQDHDLPYVDNEGPERKLKLPTRALEIFNEVRRKPVVHKLLKELRERDEETYDHTIRVTTNALAVAWMNRGEDGDAPEITDEDMRLITEASFLHDLGKLDLPFVPRDRPPENPDEDKSKYTVLVRPQHARRPLEPQEREIMRRHAMLSIEHLQRQGYVQDKEVLGLIIFHHQRQSNPTLEANDAEAVLVDLGLNAKQRQKIRTYQQIIEVADKFDALDSERAYKPAKPPHRTKQIIEGDFKAHHGNPQYVEQMIRIYYPGLYSAYPEQYEYDSQTGAAHV